MIDYNRYVNEMLMQRMGISFIVVLMRKSIPLLFKQKESSLYE